MKTTAFLEFGLSRSMLATARPKVGSQLELSGYGFSRTVDGADVGEGKRLGGTIKVDGFFKFLKDWIPDHKGGPGNSLFLLPDPQIAAPGDSGAALTQDGKIVALVSGGHEEDTQEAQLSILPPARVNRIKFNTAAPIADNRENILKALDKMKCSENLHTVQLAKLFANPVFDSLGTESWEKLIEGKKSEISSLISNLINPVPNKEVKIKPISSKNPNIRIVRAEIEYEDGWKESLRITLDSDKPGFWEIRREEMRAR